MRHIFLNSKSEINRVSFLKFPVAIFLYVTLSGLLPAREVRYYINDQTESGPVTVRLEAVFECSDMDKKDYFFTIQGDGGQAVNPQSGNFLTNPVMNLTPDDERGSVGRFFTLRIGKDRNNNQTLENDEICLEGKVIPIKIQILQKQGIFPPKNITDKTQDESGGKKIRLQSKVSPGNLPIQSRTWNIEGNTLKNYEANDSQGRVIHLGDQELNAQDIDYYWSKDGNGLKVRHEIRVNGKTFAAKTTFNISIPDTTMSFSTGQIRIRPFFPGSATLFVQFGSSLDGETPGFQAGRTFGGGGTTQWVQLIKTRRQRIDLTGKVKVAEGAGLDTDYPYTNENTFKDSPGQQLNENDLQVTIQDYFDLWLMYKPSGSDSIWIPLKKLRWGWSALAKIQENSWSLKSSAVKPVQVMDAVDYPEWNWNIRNLEWNDLP